MAGRTWGKQKVPGRIPSRRPERIRAGRLSSYRSTRAPHPIDQFAVRWRRLPVRCCPPFPHTLPPTLRGDLGNLFPPLSVVPACFATPGRSLGLDSPSLPVGLVSPSRFNYACSPDPPGGAEVRGYPPAEGWGEDAEGGLFLSGLWRGSVFADPTGGATPPGAARVVAVAETDRFRGEVCRVDGDQPIRFVGGVGPGRAVDGGLDRRPGRSGAAAAPGDRLSAGRFVDGSPHVRFVASGGAGGHSGDSG